MNFNAWEELKEIVVEKLKETEEYSSSMTNEIGKSFYSGMFHAYRDVLGYIKQYEKMFERKESE